MTFSVPPATAVALALALVLAPGAAPAQQSWSMATSWDGGPLLENAAKPAAKSIEFLTNGELKLEVFPGGKKGGTLEVTQTVRNHVTEAGHTWAGYDWGVDKAVVLLGNFAGGLDSELMFHWLYEGGGLELYRQFRREKFDVVSIPCGIVPRELGMHSRKKVQTLEDFKGLKLRTAGVWAEIVAELGAMPVTLPGAEVYPALQRGDIDAFEWAQLSIDKSLDLHKIAKYLIMPGIQQPDAVYECTFNKDSWESLSERNKRLIEIAGKLTTLDLFQRTGHEDAKAYQYYLNSGNEIVILDPEVRKKAHELSLAWAERVSAEQGGWFKKIWESQKAYRKAWEDAYKYRDTAPPLN